MFSLVKIRLAQIKYELKNLNIVHILFLVVLLIIVDIILHSMFSKYPVWTTLGLSLVIMNQHFSRKDVKFVKINIEKPRIALFFEYLFLYSIFICVSVFTSHWYCFFILLSLIALISCVKFDRNIQPTGLIFLSRIIPSTYFEALSGCRQNHILWVLVALYCSALGLCWVRGLPLFLLWFITTAICSFFGEYEPLQILRKTVSLNSVQFLREKSLRYIFPLAVLYTPIVVLNTLFHRDLAGINVFFLFLQFLSIGFAILHKYATYQPQSYFNTNSPILVIVGLCSLIPFFIPILLFLDLKYYVKAVKNLNTYL